MEVWRLILDPPQNGAMNMAIDQAVMEAVGCGEVPPTLRFYAWSPACLSLGYNQKSEEVDQARLKKFGWELVRRATGGKAILHTDELTYSVSLPQNSALVVGGIVESYRRLSRALLAGLTQLGIQVESKPKTQKQKSVGPVCFEVPSDYEITIAGRKLVGSAQVRRRNAVLQHGTLPLVGNVARICDALVFESAEDRKTAKIRVHERATTVEEAFGQVVDWETAAGLMAEAFGETFTIRLEPDTLTKTELAQAHHYRETIYGSDGWNLRR